MTSIIQKDVSDEQYIAKWKSLLEMLFKIIEKDPAPEKVKDKLLELKEVAANSNHLTERQKNGIMSRCDNYINGTFGKDSKKSDYIETNKI